MYVCAVFFMTSDQGKRRKQYLRHIHKEQEELAREYREKGILGRKE